MNIPDFVLLYCRNHKKNVMWLPSFISRVINFIYTKLITEYNVAQRALALTRAFHICIKMRQFECCFVLKFTIIDCYYPIIENICMYSFWGVSNNNQAMVIKTKAWWDQTNTEACPHFSSRLILPILKCDPF